MFDYRRLRSIAKFGWTDRVSNVQVNDLVLGTGSENTLSHGRKVSRFICCIWRTHIYRSVFYSSVEIKRAAWRRNTWYGIVEWEHVYMKVAVLRLHGWGPKDPSVSWLVALEDITRLLMLTIVLSLPRIGMTGGCTYVRLVCILYVGYYNIFFFSRLYRSTFYNHFLYRSM